MLGSEVGEVRFMRNLGLANRLVADGESLDDSAWEMLKSTTPDVEINAPFALGKIDVEGAEPLVFAGGAASLAAGNPAVWLMEFKDRLLVKFAWSAERFAKHMHDHGYRLGVYDAERNELSFPDQAWINHDNVLAVAEASVDEVRSRLADSPREIPGAPPLS